MGFNAAAIWIKGDNQDVVFHFNSMTAGSAVRAGTAAVNWANGDHITGIDATGFSVGTAARTNGSGTTFNWVAFNSASNRVAVATYTGTGTNVGMRVPLPFEPALLVVLRLSQWPTVFTWSMTNKSFVIDGTLATDRILSADATGFDVAGSSPAVNDGEPHHYLAIRRGAWAVSDSFTGDGADNRSRSNLGFPAGVSPELVFLQCEGASPQKPVFKTLGSGANTDSAWSFDVSPFVPNAIQQLAPGGYQVGSSGSANNSGRVCHSVTLSP